MKRRIEITKTLFFSKYYRPHNMAQQSSSSCVLDIMCQSATIYVLKYDLQNIKVLIQYAGNYVIINNAIYLELKREHDQI